MGQELVALNGSVVEVGQLADVCRLRADRMGISWSLGAIDEFDPLARSRPARWEHAVASAIFAMSGQCPRRDELLQGRALLDRLPRSLRASIGPREVLGLLAPLLVGVRTTHAAGFVDEANRIEEAACVMQRLLEPAPLVIDVPLCAHRESPARLPAGLAPAPCERAIDRVCGLLRAIAAGSAVSKLSVRMLQQGPTERAAACMFPAVFVAYASRGRTDELLGLLAGHQRGLARQLRRATDDRVDFTAGGLDDLSCAAENDLVALHGARWMTLDPGRAWSSPWAQGELGRMMLRSAIQHVERLMPEVGHTNAPRSHGSPAARAAVEWFAQRSTMSVHARALFEIAFYRRCALRARERDAIGFGLDRDFAPFQRLAWHSAFERELGDGVPLVYARRSEEMRRGGALRQLGFRQFWHCERALEVAA
ncbi:MAG TPA: hypothetical protein VG755_11685 [Nannocystaceae bacterium]|nr:hypothetical protein [Nannocystaceae bacterium]